MKAANTAKDVSRREFFSATYDDAMASKPRTLNNDSTGETYGGGRGRRSQVTFMRARKEHATKRRSAKPKRVTLPTNRRSWQGRADKQSRASRLRSDGNKEECEEQQKRQEGGSLARFAAGGVAIRKVEEGVDWAPRRERHKEGEDKNKKLPVVVVVVVVLRWLSVDQGRYDTIQNRAWKPGLPGTLLAEDRLPVCLSVVALQESACATAPRYLLANRNPLWLTALVGTYLVCRLGTLGRGGQPPSHCICPRIW
ncbi:hypothetical protein F4780DRAFT_444609 [Xylariomycetidae sp. FL0641]|nr:hypothetical protein F4780DRAFT_444609 [Xylariomycetidae sp. FL0641]